jgi:ribosome-binding factor A
MATDKRRRHNYGDGRGPYSRLLRVNKVLCRSVGEELERLADADERLRFLTVTAAEVSSDLRNATIYLSSVRSEALEALEERRAALQRYVSTQTRMKRTPILHFEADPGVAAGARLDEVLRRIAVSPTVSPTLGPTRGSDPVSHPCEDE